MFRFQNCITHHASTILHKKTHNRFQTRLYILFQSPEKYCQQQYPRHVGIKKGKKFPLQKIPSIFSPSRQITYPFILSRYIKKHSDRSMLRIIPFRSFDIFLFVPFSFVLCIHEYQLTTAAQISETIRFFFYFNSLFRISEVFTAIYNLYQQNKIILNKIVFVNYVYLILFINI